MIAPPQDMMLVERAVLPLSWQGGRHNCMCFGAM